jgi:cytochrome c peroxidase
MIAGGRWRSRRSPKARARLAISSGLAVVGVTLAAASQERVVPATGEPIAPVPSVVPPDLKKARLGERLFRDVRLSHDDKFACVSCHRLDRGGDDGQPRSMGGDGRPLDFNTPTVFNANLNFRLNWRGNFRGLEEQAEAVLLDARLMGTSWPELIAKLNGDPTYSEAFVAAYGQPVTRNGVLDALAAFERSLVTPRAPFDRYLAGQDDAIGYEAKRGYQLFKSHGCVACHQGVNVGGNLFERFGVFDDPGGGGPIAPADLGRFTLTGKAEDRSVFRVPSLRNVAETAPYFHDGRARTLEQAVAVMARLQLGRELDPDDIHLIVRFLHALTGEYRPLDGPGQRTPAP